MKNLAILLLILFSHLANADQADNPEDQVWQERTVIFRISPTCQFRIITETFDDDTDVALRMYKLGKCPKVVNLNDYSIN